MVTKTSTADRDRGCCGLPVVVPVLRESQPVCAPTKSPCPVRLGFRRKHSEQGKRHGNTASARLSGPRPVFLWFSAVLLLRIGPCRGHNLGLAASVLR